MKKGYIKKNIPLVFFPCFCSIKTIIYTEQVIVDLPRLYIVHVLAGILCIRQNTKYLFCDFINFFQNEFCRFRCMLCWSGKFNVQMLNKNQIKCSFYKNIVFIGPLSPNTCTYPWNCDCHKKIHENWCRRISMKPQ